MPAKSTPQTFSYLRTYGLTAALTLISCIAVGFGMGLSALITTIVLIILEVSLSFDNAVVNAKVLKNMSPAWQRAFLTIGILIAVFGVRLVLPILLVTIIAGLSVGSVIDLIANNPKEYGEVLHSIHPEIAAFGGMFLLLLFLDYIFEDRRIRWLGRLEAWLAKIGQFDRFEIVLALGALLLATRFAEPSHTASMLIAGLVGIMLYVGIKALGAYFEQKELAEGTAKAGFISFMYLEVLDASFSLDGVLGAFAITSNIIVITVGLGIGALWVRSMTIHLVRSDTLQQFRYLEHGAHYAIGTLAVLLLTSASYEINEMVTGLLGFLIIAAAFMSSVSYNRIKDRRKEKALG